MIWPKHHSMTIWHNEHRSRNESIEEYLKDPHLEGAISFEDYNKCIEMNEIWECQLYPRTHISFIHIVVPTWDRLEEEVAKLAENA